MTDLYPRDEAHAAELMADMTRRENTQIQREEEAASGNEQE